MESKTDVIFNFKKKTKLILNNTKHAGFWGFGFSSYLASYLPPA